MKNLILKHQFNVSNQLICCSDHETSRNLSSICCLFMYSAADDFPFPVWSNQLNTSLQLLGLIFIYLR